MSKAAVKAQLAASTAENNPPENLSGLRLFIITVTPETAVQSRNDTASVNAPRTRNVNAPESIYTADRKKS